MLKAMQQALERIDHEFALESAKVYERSFVHIPGSISGGIVNPGHYVVDETVVCPRTLSVITLSPALAHHLRGIGKADIKYRNGKVETARTFQPSNQFEHARANALRTLIERASHMEGA